MAVFLTNVMLDHPYPISTFNCREFMELILKERAAGATSLTWSDIRKVNCSGEAIADFALHVVIILLCRCYERCDRACTSRMLVQVY